MKSVLISTIFFFSSVFLFGQNLSSKLQSALDSIYYANQDAIGIMSHVESPTQNISWSGAIGFSNKETKAKLEADQPILIASSIKTYVSATILRLIENEKLSLEDPIGPIVSKKSKRIFKRDGYDFSAIKVKHLLSHTSGIEDYANQEYIDYIDKNPTHRWTRKEQLKLATKVGDRLGAPGEKFSYADANYLLLTEIIEGKSDLPFYSAMRQLLRYEELGLEHTWFPTLEDKPKNTKELVHQYWTELGWDSHVIDISFDLYGGGGIASTTEELALFIHNYFNTNIVQNESVRDLIFTEIKTKETEEHPYYLGLSQDEYHGYKGYGHGGFWGTVMLHFPELNMSISVCILDRDKKGLRKNVIEALTKIVIAENDELTYYQEPLDDLINSINTNSPNLFKGAFSNELIDGENDIQVWQKRMDGVKKRFTEKYGVVKKADFKSEFDKESSKLIITLPDAEVMRMEIIFEDGRWKFNDK